MTRNQIEALKLQETARHNKEMEGLSKAEIPAQYISSVGSLARGFGGLKSGFSSNSKAPTRARQTGMDTFVLY